MQRNRLLSLLLFMAFSGATTLCFAQTNGLDSTRDEATPKETRFQAAGKPITNQFELNKDSFQEVRVSVELSNIDLICQSTNVIKYAITNLSKGRIGVLGRSVWPIRVYLTNDTGVVYRISPREETAESMQTPGGWVKPPMPKFSMGLNVNEGYGNYYSFCLGSDVKPGHYRLEAEQGVITPDAEYYWIILTPPIAVEVKGATTSPEIKR